MVVTLVGGYFARFGFEMPKLLQFGGVGASLVVDVFGITVGGDAVPAASNCFSSSRTKYPSSTKATKITAKQQA